MNPAHSMNRKGLGRMSGVKKISIAIILLSVIFAKSALASVKDDVKKGNLLYNKNNYTDAAKLYEKAASQDPSSGIGSFNLGLAKYKVGGYKAAIEKFNNAIASGKTGQIPAADYNIANAQYRLGSAAEKADINPVRNGISNGIKKAKEFYETALKFYKRSIDLNPDDKDAKFNYEFVEKKMNELAEKYQMKKDEEKNKDKKDQEDKGKEGKDKGKEGENKGKEEKGKQQEEKKQEENKKEEGKQGEQPQGGGEEKQQEKPQGGGEEKQKEQPQGGKEGKQEEEKPQEPQAAKEAGQEEKEKPQAAAGAEEKKGKPEESGLQAYQAPQSEGNGEEMSAQEAKMLLEGYKGEEATGRAVKLRRKKIDLPEPVKDW